ncbi:rhoptry neck protein 6, putative [Plasmodium ovale]|nr:rhoptry neck protein 6, putative [Plasmodium ovale]
MESSEILSEPVSMKLLHNEILFENIKIIMPGEYNLCIAQFYQQPEKEEMLANNASNKNKKKRKNDIKIMGIDTIGTLYVLPLPMKK